jgi:hypothetical protein
MSRTEIRENAPVMKRVSLLRKAFEGAFDGGADRPGGGVPGEKKRFRHREKRILRGTARVGQGFSPSISSVALRFGRCLRLTPQGVESLSQITDGRAHRLR